MARQNRNYLRNNYLFFAETIIARREKTGKQWLEAWKSFMERGNKAATADAHGM